MPKTPPNSPKRASEHDLIFEERWVPVTESGDRWLGRTKEAAEASMAKYPAGGCYIDGEPWDGVAYIEREFRYVTEWKTLP